MSQINQYHHHQQQQQQQIINASTAMYRCNELNKKYPNVCIYIMCMCVCLCKYIFYDLFFYYLNNALWFSFIICG